MVGTKLCKKTRVDVPTLEALFSLTKSQRFQLSTTNLVYIDRERNCVYKATLNTPLNRISNLTLPQTNDLGSKTNVATEVSMLKFLSGIGIRTPRVIGTNKNEDVFAMEYIAGKTLLDKTIDSHLSEEDIRLAGKKLAELHKATNTEKNLRWIAENSKSYPRHFPNRVEGFLDRYGSLCNIKNPSLRNAFMDAKKHLDANADYMIWKDPTYGDYKPENIISTESGELVVLDPGLRLGRTSFDVGKFASRLLLAKAPIELTRLFLQQYQSLTDNPLKATEIGFMTALDIITILAVYDGICTGDNAPIFPERIYKLVKETSEIIDTLVYPLLHNKFRSLHLK